MKKVYFILAIAAVTFASCGNNASSGKSKVDSSASVTNPPDNSAATNPSLADTLYNKDSTRVKKDSAR
jgi:predicted small secreted protein